MPASCPIVKCWRQQYHLYQAPHLLTAGLDSLPSTVPVDQTLQIDLHSCCFARSDLTSAKLIFRQLPAWMKDSIYAGCLAVAEILRSLILSNVGSRQRPATGQVPHATARTGAGTNKYCGAMSRISPMLHIAAQSGLIGEPYYSPIQSHIFCPEGFPVSPQIPSFGSMIGAC